MTKHVTVKIYIDRAAAIRAGRSEYADKIVKLDPSLLDEASREILLTVETEYGKDHFDLSAFSVKDDSIESVIDALFRYKAGVEMKEREAKERRRKNQEDYDKRAAAWLTLTDEELITQKADRYGNLYSPDPEYMVPPLVKDPRIEKRAEAIRNEIKRRKTEQDAERERRKAKEAREKQAAVERKRQQLADFIGMHGDDSQRKRLAANMLSEDEILASYRDHAFRKLDHLTRYEKITDAEMRAEAADYEKSADIEFIVNDADSATAEEFEVLEAIRSRITKNYPNAVVTLRRHEGTASFTNEIIATIDRASVLVTITDGELTLSREYAV